MPKKLLDSSRIKLLGWEPRTSLREGIKKTVEWYKNERLKKDTNGFKETNF